MDSDKLRVARDKLTRVFRYLEALNQHRNPAKRQIREQLWSLWLHGLPDHLCITRGMSKSQSSNGKTGKAQSADEGHERFVLKVQRPVLSRPPEPPEEAAIWLEPGWDDPSEEILIHQSRNESDQAGNPRVVNFADDKRRFTALPRWKLLRDEWAKSEKPARIRGTEFLRNPDRAMKQVFEKLQLLEISAATPKKDTAKMVRISPHAADAKTGYSRNSKSSALCGSTWAGAALNGRTWTPLAATDTELLNTIRVPGISPQVPPTIPSPSPKPSTARVYGCVRL